MEETADSTLSVQCGGNLQSVTIVIVLEVLWQQIESLQEKQSNSIFFAILMHLNYHLPS